MMNFNEFVTEMRTGDDSGESNEEFLSFSPNFLALLDAMTGVEWDRGGYDVFDAVPDDAEKPGLYVYPDGKVYVVAGVRWFGGGRTLVAFCGNLK